MLACWCVTHLVGAQCYTCMYLSLSTCWLSLSVCLSVSLCAACQSVLCRNVSVQAAYCLSVCLQVCLRSVTYEGHACPAHAYGSTSLSQSLLSLNIRCYLTWAKAAVPGHPAESNEGRCLFFQSKPARKCSAHQERLAEARAVCC